MESLQDGYKKAYGLRWSRVNARWIVNVHISELLDHTFETADPDFDTTSNPRRVLLQTRGA